MNDDRRALVAALLRERGVAPAPANRAIPRRGPGEPPVLSFGQERLWFLDMMHPGSWAYVISQSSRLPGAVNADILEWAVNEIVRRHEALRTNYVSRDGRPELVTAPLLDISVNRIDLTSLPDSERDAKAADLAAAEAQTPFDVAGDPLLRVTLIKLGPADCILSVSIHHIVTDAWSMDLFFSELFTLYNAAIAGKPSPLPDLPIQYADYAVWQRRQLAGDSLETLVSYWREQLDGAPPLIPLVTDKPRPPVQSGTGARQGLLIAQDIIEPLRRIGRGLDATLFMTLLAGFKTLLFKLCGQPHIVVGTPSASRTCTEIEQLIGFFVNTLVLHTDLSDDTTFNDIVLRVRTVTLGAYEHQQMPFDKLVECLKPPRTRAYNPLFQIMFNLQNGLRQVSTPEYDPDDADETRVWPGAPKFDMEWAILEHDRGVTLSIEYSTDLYTDATIAELGRAYRKLLQDVAADPGLRLSQIRIGSARAEESVPADLALKTADDFDF